MKTLKYTLLAALSIFAAASCTKESTGDIQQPSAGVDVKAVFEAVAEDDMSKALLQSNGGLQWENGDQIAVYQYGYYTADDNNTAVKRDYSKNIFTSDGTAIFSGSIANYQPLVVEKILADKANYFPERYYAVYPAAKCSEGGGTYGKYKVKIPDTQTGLLSDFKNNAVYLGYQRASSAEDALVSYDGQTLTFLNPFNMFCMTPVLKFNVPASLNVTKIVLSAQDADGNDVALAGSMKDVRCDAGTQPTFTTSVNEIVVENAGAVLSNDVYVVLAPNKNSLPSGASHAQFKSSAKTLVLNLFMASGADATLQLPLTGEILAGTIKNLPALPNSVNWNYPAGPGLSAIEINKTSITTSDGNTLSARQYIFLTPENTESTITYRQRTSLSSLLGATIMNDYNSEHGIKRSDDSTPENFFEIKVSTEGYADYKAYACTWILYKSYGFGKVLTNESASEDFNPTEGSTYPFDGSYLYGLSYTYLTPPANTETTFKIPEIKSDGMYLSSSYTSKTPAKYWSGSLNVKIPQTGKAQLLFDCTLTSGTRRIIVKRGEETLDTVLAGTTDTYGAYHVSNTVVIDVEAGDVLEVTNDKYVLFNSMTLLWQPTETEASLATESYASKTSYGN